MLLAAIAAVDKAVGAVQAWQQYRLLQETDPSGSDAYLAFAQFDSILAGIGVGTAVVVWWVLRPVPREARGAVNVSGDG